MREGPGICLGLPDVYTIHINELGKGSFYARNNKQFPFCVLLSPRPKSSKAGTAVHCRLK